MVFGAGLSGASKAGALVDHPGEGFEDFAHGRAFIGKEVLRVHVMDDERVICLEEQEIAGRVFRAIDAKIIETDRCGDGVERAAMAVSEKLVEMGEKRLFFLPFGRTLIHLRVEIPEFPICADRHMHRVGAPVDEDDPVFPVEPVIALIGHEIRDEKGCVRAFYQVIGNRAGACEAGEIAAGMGAYGAQQDRETQIGVHLCQAAHAGGDLGEVAAGQALGCGYCEAGDLTEPAAKPGPVEAQDSVGLVQDRPGPVLGLRSNLGEKFSGAIRIAGRNDHCDIMFWQRVGHWEIGRDIERFECDRRAGEEKIERCVIAHLHRCCERQQFAKCRTVMMGPEEPGFAQRPRLKQTPAHRIAAQLFHKREIHIGACIFGVGRDCIFEKRGKGGHISALIGGARQGRDTHLAGWFGMFSAQVGFRHSAPRLKPAQYMAALV